MFRKNSGQHAVSRSNTHIRHIPNKVLRNIVALKSF
jgi:hypothetical protein